MGNHLWGLRLCKLHKCFDSSMTYSITVAAEFAFIRDSWAPAEKFPADKLQNAHPPPLPKTKKGSHIAKNGLYGEKSSIKAPTWKKSSR